MIPTLKQIKRLNQLLLDLHALGVPPEIVKFSHRSDKPFIILIAEPIHDIKESRWYFINHNGELI